MIGVIYCNSYMVALPPCVDSEHRILLCVYFFSSRHMILRNLWV